MCTAGLCAGWSEHPLLRDMSALCHLPPSRPPHPGSLPDPVPHHSRTLDSGQCLLQLLQVFDHESRLTAE